MSTVFVSGALANRPGNGGGAWVRLNWILGLKQLGFQVYFVEEIREENCRDKTGAATTFTDSVNRDFFRKVVGRFGLAESSALLCEAGDDSRGGQFDEVMELAPSADLLINLGGHLTLPPLLERFRRKAYVDLDPGFTQIWHETGSSRLAGHDVYFTVGTNIGSADCTIPTSGISWQPILPPIVLEEWPVCPQERLAAFTTIANWRGPFGPVQWHGKTLGLKVHEFRKFLDLPARTGQRFELALNIHRAEEKDLEALNHHGWRIVDPSDAAGDPDSYRRYVQKSGAEFSAAQEIYVATQSGWFSDRTAAYLASGKPGLVQETGFGRTLPVGKGLVSFRTPTEACDGARKITDDYASHCSAARAIAEEFFDSRKVLGSFMERAGIQP